MATRGNALQAGGGCSTEQKGRGRWKPVSHVGKKPFQAEVLILGHTGIPGRFKG